MLSNFQRMKLDRRFALLDLDASGSLTAADYDELSLRVCKGAGVEAESEQGKAIHEAFKGLWDALAGKYDRDGNGRITRDEWVDSVARSVIEQEAFDRVIEPVVRTVLAAYDADGDGVLSGGEYRALAVAMSVPGADAEVAFGHLDQSGDGSLSRDELVQAVKEFYTSADPHAPGNWFYGKI